MRAFGRGAARSGPNGSRRPLGLLLLPFRRNVSAPGAVRRIARHAIAALTVLRCCRLNPNDKSQNDQKHRHGYLRIRYQLRRRQLGSAESAASCERPTYVGTSHGRGVLDGWLLHRDDATNESSNSTYGTRDARKIFRSFDSLFSTKSTDVHHQRPCALRRVGFPSEDYLAVHRLK